MSFITKESRSQLYISFSYHVSKILQSGTVPQSFLDFQDLDTCENGPAFGHSPIPSHFCIFLHFCLSLQSFSVGQLVQKKHPTITRNQEGIHSLLTTDPT